MRELIASKLGIGQEKSAEATKGLYDKLKSHITDSTKKAWEKSFGKSWLDTLNPMGWPKNAFLFLKNFLSEMTDLEKEKADVKKETEEKVEKAMLTQAKLPEIPEKSKMAELVGYFEDGARETGKKEEVQGLFDRIKISAETGEVPNKQIDKDEAKLLFSAGFFSLIKLKDKYPDNKKLSKFFEEVKDEGKGLNVDLNHFKNYFSNYLGLLFSFEQDKFPEVLGAEINMVGGLLDFGKGLTTMEVKTLAEIGVKQTLEQEFPNTHANIAGFNRIMKYVEKAANKTPLTVDEMADIITILDRKDLQNLATSLSTGNLNA